MELSGKVALVTGGGRGLGAAICEFTRSVCAVKVCFTCDETAGQRAYRQYCFNCCKTHLGKCDSVSRQ